MRKLASIREIKEIRPIANADAIELVIVDGWQVIAKKGEFSPGEKCIYFEIDSVLPIHPAFEFLRKSCYVKKDWIAAANPNNPTGEGFRLRTIKLRGEISQGLVVPVLNFFNIDYDVGEDVTELLNVIKWDPPVPAQLAGRAKGNFPAFIPKTDQERAQNMENRIFGKLLNEEFEVTLKLDGSSCTVYYNNGTSGVCSRNYDLDLGEENADNSFIRAARESGILDALKEYCEIHSRNLAIQSELMGPGVQGNRENFSELRLYVFDVYDIDRKTYLNDVERDDVILDLRAMCLNKLQFLRIPLVTYAKPAFFESLDHMLAFASGWSINNRVREGLVWKSCNDPNISFKTISNEFLLKEE